MIYVAMRVAQYSSLLRYVSLLHAAVCVYISISPAVNAVETPNTIHPVLYTSLSSRPLAVSHIWTKYNKRWECCAKVVCVREVR